MVEDELLDAEKTLIEFPWSASSTYNNNLFIKQYKYNEEGNGVEFIELNYRLAAMKGITGDASDGSTEKKVSFPRMAVVVEFAADVLRRIPSDHTTPEGHHRAHKAQRGTTSKGR